MFKKALATTALLMLAGSAAHAQYTIYDNTVNFNSSTGTSNGGATTGNAITTLVADDITFLSGYAGKQITQFSFSVSNYDTATFTARPRIRFYDTTGANGGPGNYITGFSFNPISFTSNNTATFFSTLGANVFLVPTSGSLWAGITFDNVGATATVANLNNLGQEVFSPPTVGSSTSSFFVSNETAAGGSYLVNTPGGTIYSGFTGGTPGNFGWQFQVAAAAAPEPSQYAAFGLGILGVGALALKARRRGVTA